ncbi:site-specific integrase [Selenomonas sp.]|uniref:tyrosine-type recombinase/integrase n=1 Tax=Selenomonas sp. TaxID=2053611 RepID=UPI0025FEF225|nr:site-specific integrase [Selenomonas sp.]MBQ1868803.1 site-specific integrase [Selenomonas sp.]
MTTTKKNAKHKRAASEGSIYFEEKKGLWVASLRIGYHPKTGKPIRKKRYAKTQQDALAKLAEIRVKYATVTHVDADTITTGQWLIKWFETFSRPKIRENTQQSYRYILQIAIEEVGQIKLDKLTDVDLQGVIFGRLRHHFRTAQFFRTIIKAALKRAVKSRLLRESPAEDLELPKRPPKRKFAKPTAEAWHTLIEYHSDKYYGWRWILLTEFVTGARMSELLGLQWEDLSLHRDAHGRLNGSLHIRHALYLGYNDQKGQKRPVLLGPTKTAEGNRILPIPPDYCQEMLTYRKLQLEMRLRTQNFQDTGFIFTQQDGRPINPGSFSSYYSMTRKKLGIATTFHMLRHDMASRMKGTGKFDLKDIQTQLGHSSIQITMDTYTHIDETQKEQISCWLESGIDEILGRETRIQKGNQ